MTTEERLKYLANQLVEIGENEKQVKAEKEEVRGEFFRLLRRCESSRNAPIRTVEVPADFFEKTGLTRQAFADTRFPGWEVEHIERDISSSTVVFILKRDPEYLPGSITTDTHKVSKVVSEYSPEIDWDTLQIEKPELFDRLADPKIIYEINETGLEQLMEETPEELAVLQRHMKVRKPSLKITTRKLKDA